MEETKEHKLSDFLGTKCDFVEFIEISSLCVRDLTYNEGILTGITLEGGIKDFDNTVIYPFKMIKIPVMAIKEFNSSVYDYCQKQIESLSELKPPTKDPSNKLPFLNRLVDYLETEIDSLRIEDLREKGWHDGRYRRKMAQTQEILKWVKENK